MNTTVDTIIVSFNTKDHLRESLASLRASLYPVAQVFVVDNASTDGSPQMVAAEFPDSALLAMGENLGFARANNAAFDRCTSETILLLNPDARLSPQALDRLTAELESDRRIAAVGPVLVGTDGRVQFEGGRREPSILGEFANISGLNARFPRSAFGRYLMNDWDHRSTRDIEVLSGACMLLRREALCGRLFDENYFMYGEDIELCRRLRGSGWRVRYVGDAEVTHDGAVSSRKVRSRMRVAGVRSMAKYLSRTRGVLYAAGYLLILPVAWLSGIALKRVRPI